MGIIVNNQDKRSELQKRLEAELKEKIAKNQGAGPDPELETPDFVNDSEYMNDYKKKFDPNNRIIGIVVASVIVLVIVGLLIAIGG